MQTIEFWESRAQAYAAEGDGLRAICSYAMPRFYNWSIDVTQRAALRSTLRSIPAGANVLDYGCGVGRWTREIAKRGAKVTAVDFSAAMLSEAARRTAASPHRDACRFIRCDVTNIDLDERFDVIFGVTVLQHVLGTRTLAATIVRLAQHLKPGGRLIMVEAAPTLEHSGCDTQTFHARTLSTYVSHAVDAGLRITHVAGVDPAPFKLWVVPRFKRWPRPLALSFLAAATLLALPFDLLLAKLKVHQSWHKIIVAVAPEEGV